MLTLASASRILLYPGPTDMRLGIWSLSSRCGELRDGELHVFCSKDRRTVKIVLAERGSTWLLQKRLASGRFSWPGSGPVSKVCLLQLQAVLDSPQTIAEIEGWGKP